MNTIQRITVAVALAATALLPLAAQAAPLAKATGSFVTGAHETKGTATIYKLDDGTRILRLTNFETSNGPKVHVVLADHHIAGNAVTNAHSVDLGDLKGTKGNQNYVIPKGTDLSKIRSVAIYCERFHVNFGAADIR